MFRGDATPCKGVLLFRIQFAENAVWTYEQPFAVMQAIAGMVSFYPNLVEITEVADQAVGGG